jgi:predicted kinase
MLIAFSGLPGTGKTTIARRLAYRIRAAYLRIDTIEDALARSALAIAPAQDTGYVAACAVALDNLANGLPVVADSVNPIPLTRNAFRALAESSGASFLDVEIVCSDVREHRRRVEARRAGGGRPHPTWEDVERRHYAPWDRERVVVDTGRLGVTEAVSLNASQVEAVKL